MAGAFWIFVVSLVGACSAQTSVQAEREVVVLPASGNQLITFATLVCYITPEEVSIPVRWIAPDGVSIEGPSAQYITNIGSLGSIDGSPKFGSLLIIRDISYRNAGTYLCEVMDEGSCSEFPKFAMVELVLRMTLDVASRNVTVYTSSSKSSEVELQCEATGYIRPDSDLQWFKEDLEVTASEKYQIFFRDGQPNMAQMGQNETSPSRIFVLKINNVDVTDISKYSCRSKDTGAVASIYLEVENEPTPSISTSSHEPSLIQPTPTSYHPAITSSPADIAVGSSHTSSAQCTIGIAVAVLCTFALTATLTVFVTIGAIYLWFKRRASEGESNISSPNVSTFPVSPESPVDKGMVDIYQISTGDEMEGSNGTLKQGSVKTST